jgi:hypothetical protein
VIVKIPVAKSVGVPLISPVVALRDKPLGRVPELTVYANGGLAKPTLVMAIVSEYGTP